MPDDLPATLDAPSASRARARRRIERRRRWAWRLAGYVFFLGLWELASTVLVASHVLPPPQEIVGTIADIIRSGELLTHFGATLRTIAIGFGIAFLVGSGVAFAMGRSKWWEGFLGDWVTATMSTPGLVFALVSAIIFGLGTEGPIVAVVVTTYSFVAVNIVEGVRAVPNDLVAMSRSFRVPGLRIQRHVLIPFLAPYFFTAMRYGFSTAWKIATLTEIVVGTKGIGFVMRREFQSFHMAGLLAWVILFFGFALFLERVVLQRQIRHFFRWRPEVAR